MSELRWVLCMRLVAGWPRVRYLLVPGCDAGPENGRWLAGPLPVAEAAQSNEWGGRADPPRTHRTASAVGPDSRRQDLCFFSLPASLHQNLTSSVRPKPHHPLRLHHTAHGKMAERSKAPGSGPPEFSLNTVQLPGLERGASSNLALVKHDMFLMRAHLNILF